jgi:hypothetical protein
MSKEEVLAAFEADFENTVTDKDSEYLTMELKKSARRLVVTDRSGVIDACRYWIYLKREPFTLLAVVIIMDLALKELKPELIVLKKDIQSGKLFKTYYNELVDNALNAVT